MRKYLFLTILLSCLTLGARGQTALTDLVDLSGLPKQTVAKWVRYWFDNDDKNAATTTDLNGSYELETVALDEGVHVVHFQIIDDQGIASVTDSKMFIKIGKQLTLQKVRYWFDNANTVTTTEDLDGKYELDVKNLSEGVHIVHFQNVYNNGTVGTIASRMFMKLSAKTAPEVTTILYWFDEDAANLKEAGIENLTMTVDAISLRKGDHILNYQLKMSDGSVSPVVTATFNNSNMVREKESITISGAGQVPYCGEYDLDFTNLPELKAYVATGYDKAKGTIWLTRVKQVPAETGFLLTGEEGDYEVPVSESASDCYYKNMFKGTLTGTTLYTTDGDYTNYYLSKGDAGVGFYKVTKEEGVKVGANRCYLPILTEIPANGSEGDTELIKVTAAKQVPYFTSKNLDFSSMDAQGVKAYTATGYNYGTGVIWLTRVKKVPAKTGILVMTDKEGEYNVPTASVQSVYENMFVGSETAQTIYTNEEIDGVDYVNYYLSKGDAGVGFYKVTNPDGISMGANRCYLPIPKRDAASGVRGMNLETEAFCHMILSDEANDDVIAIPVFGGMNGEDDGTTGIEVPLGQRPLATEGTQESSIFNDQSNEVYYNLQGQRVNNPTKGLYIRNGKKVVIK